MKIVQIGSYPLSADCIHGGVESSVFGLVNELAKCHKVDVFDTPRIGVRDSIEHFGNLTIHRYANQGTHNKDSQSKIPTIVTDIIASNPDICHIHGTGLVAAGIYDALNKHHFKIILTVHGLLKVEKQKALKRHFSIKGLYQYIRQSRVESLLLNKLNTIIVDTDYVRNAFNNYGLKRLPEIHVIPQGINPDYYQLNAEYQQNTILSVGAISQRKGQLHTIKAYSMLRDMGIDIKLSLVGIIAEQQYYEQVCKAISECEYKNDISLKINLPQNELIQEYQHASLFMLHSQEESQGIVLAKAMAAGLPVVATNVGGIPNVVTDGVTGLLSEYADTQAMALNAKTILQNSEKWSKFSLSAKQAA